MKIELPPYCCDVCKKRRDQDVNHWHVMLAVYEGGRVPYLQAFPWNDVPAALDGAAHACGQEHAQELFARWMDHGNFEKKAPLKEHEPESSVI